VSSLHYNFQSFRNSGLQVADTACGRRFYNEPERVSKKASKVDCICCKRTRKWSHAIEREGARRQRAEC